MTPARPEPGHVISYAYLWHSEFAAGQEEGLKDRPCLIVSAACQPEGDIRVTLIPITHVPPAPTYLAEEIPSLIRGHLKLDDQRSWILLSEWNEFRWPGPDLRYSAPGNRLVYEFLPPRYFEKIRRRFVDIVSAGRAVPVRRTE